MTKRAREPDTDSQLPAKRLRYARSDRLSLLSDELLIRTLSYLSVSDLVLCERLSRRLQSLAADSQLWKGLFYNRFVRPRASRIPGLRDQEACAKSLYYSSRLSKWLDDDHLVKRGKSTNWKRQYKLRHNWSRGSARISETTVAEQPSIPPLLVRLCNDVVIIVDAKNGLRAWTLKGADRLIANVANLPGIPTALAVDDTESPPHEVRVSIGFDDGNFAFFTLEKQTRKFALRYTHTPSTNGRIHAMAYASPYLITMTGEPLLSLYHVQFGSNNSTECSDKPPRLVSSLRSHTAYPPISLGIRTAPASVIASIAYAVPTWTLGWTLGLQEVQLTDEGVVAESRMASSPMGPLAVHSSQQPAGHAANRCPNDRLLCLCDPNLGRFPFVTKPTSLSYNHPYLLSAHADNTLTLYLVTSNTKGISIGPGTRLWGHTSSVTDAQVGDRGKAVSVSALGDELRVWELEGGLSSNTSKKRAAAGESSVQVCPERTSVVRAPEVRNTVEAGVAGIISSSHGKEKIGQESSVTQGWVAFDEEKVVLLREKLQGAQALVVYDFS